MEEQSKKVKKNKANAVQDFSHSGDSMHMKVKDKKRMKKKKDKICDAIESTLIQSKDTNVKDGAEVGITNIKEGYQKKSNTDIDKNGKELKKGKKNCKDGEAVEIEIASNETARVGEENSGRQSGDGKDSECDSRLEAREDRKKRHKKNQEKDGINSFEKRDSRAEINSGEEGSRKEKNKKAKKNKEVSNFEGKESVGDEEKLGKAREHNDEKTMGNDAEKVKKKRKKMDGEIEVSNTELDKNGKEQKMVRKKGKKISKDGEAVEVKVASNETARVGEENSGRQSGDGKDSDCGSRLEAREDREKRPKKNQEKDGINSFEKRDSAEINSGEEGSRKEKNKKARKNKEVSNFEGKESVADEEKLGKAREHNDEKTTENDAEKVKKKRKKMDGETEVCVTAMEGGKKEKRKKRKSVKDSLEETVYGVEEGGKRKKRAKSVNDISEGTGDKGASVTKISADGASLSENPKSKRTPKKVRFSGHVEIFPSSDDLPDSKMEKNGRGLVQGKRFSPEEDEMIRAAVYNYIDEHGLGEDGLDKVLHCGSHAEARGCWKEIALAIPWRPREAIYCRGHILFQRAESRAWTPEEYEIVRRFHAQHGSDWTVLADALGKHRIHVKDTWRRIKLTNEKAGRWSQEEYQTLFDLVNMDLQMKAFEEKKTKHGMLRDNIGWGAISDKLGTRINANCCTKWYNQLTSPMVAEGKWADTDDYRLLDALFSLDECCMEDVDWDNLIEHRSGDLCRKRWLQMVKHIGDHGNKSFAEQVEILLQRYNPDLLEAREEYAKRPAVDEIK